MSPDYQLRLYDDLVEAGADLGLRPFGLRALDSLRLEKGFGTWAREFRPIYTPAEAGLDRFVDLRKERLSSAAMRCCRTASRGRRSAL